ncbi:MAG TPA: sugar phosphate nucleotidyltransferase [Anaerolineaceae bacterium]|nr:sugar phosphate nucleotidyltransferase [Anaerolineaceae bacterium]
MKTRAVILAGGEGTRLGVLTAKRTKPAVPFAGKYRIIDFPLSNCVNSNIYDVMIIAQYRPQSLIEHIGSGGPWDLNRDFTGGVRIFTPYKSRASSWFIGTADAVQQNFSFIKRGDPDMVMILSGDHVYSMDYTKIIEYHQQHQADLTMATIRVPIEEASRYGIIGVDPDFKVTSFVEKPTNPTSNLVNMGVYLFNRQILDQILWNDSQQKDSTHDFGKDILPSMVRNGMRAIAYPYDGYWVDVGTVESYWKAHMDLLHTPSPFNLNDRTWVMHTRTEERPPVRIDRGAVVEDSMICDGCVIENGARVVRSILSPGVNIRNGATVTESIILTDSQVNRGAVIARTILDKNVKVLEEALIGEAGSKVPTISMVGKNSVIPPRVIIQAGASIGPDVIAADYSSTIIETGQYIQTRRLPYEI